MILPGLALFAKEYEKEIQALRSQAEAVDDSLWQLKHILLRAGPYIQPHPRDLHIDSNVVVSCSKETDTIPDSYPQL